MNDYSNNNYYRVVKMTISQDDYKRVLIDNTVDELHTLQLQMIDDAVELSDLQQARDVIKMITDGL